MSGIDYESALDTGDVNKSNKVITLRLNTKSGGEEVTKVDETTSEPISTNVIKPMARVGFSSGMTLNLGNYESARLEVSISMPCDVSEVDDTFEFCKRFVEEKGETLLEENDLKK